MKTTPLFWLMHAIFTVSLVFSVWSFICFAAYTKSTATVREIQAGPEDVIVSFEYFADDASYTREQRYPGTSQIQCGDQRTIWYHPDDPSRTVTVQQFAAWYIVLGFFSFAETAYFAGRKLRNQTDDIRWNTE